jgi:hypothetical protein
MNSIQHRTLGGIPLGEYADCAGGRILIVRVSASFVAEFQYAGYKLTLEGNARALLSSKHFSAEKCAGLPGSVPVNGFRGVFIRRFGRTA